MIKEYDKLGKVHLKPNARAKRLTARYRDHMFVVTYPSWMKMKDVEQSLQTMAPRLLLLKERAAERFIFRPGSVLNTYSFDVQIVEEGEHFYMTLKNRILYMVCPKGTDFEEEAIQARIREGVETIMRKEARRIFPDWIKRLAEKYGFIYNSLKINKSRSRWGSCSIRKDINLSYFCLLLPEHLIELIILHELCHTLVMNHSADFWKQLDKVTAGRSEELTKELRKYKTTF